MQLHLTASAVAAIALLTTTGAHASLIFGGATSNGNSSAAFVAVDNAGTISLAVDLNTSFASFLAASGTQGVGAGITGAAGALSAPGTTATWNFSNNTFTVNSAAVSGNYQWSSNVNSFLTNTSVTGGRYKWGVVAGDGISGALSATNVIQGNNILFTAGVPIDFDNSFDSGTTPQSIADGGGAVTNFYANSNGLGTNVPGVIGANTATSGPQFLGTTLAQNGVGGFGVQVGMNDFLNAPGGTSLLVWANQGTGALGRIYQVGQTYGLGAVATGAATFSFNDSTQTLTYIMPVPEASTYAMLLAGLAAVGHVVRRRKAA